MNRARLISLALVYFSLLINTYKEDITMSVYGYLVESYPTYDCRFDDIVLEFDIKETIKTMKSKIKQAIVRFIDRISGALDKHPNSKLAMGLKNILSKAKNLLTKTDEADNDKDIQKVKEEFDDLKQEAEDLKQKSTDDQFKNIPEEFKNACSHHDEMAVKRLLIQYIFDLKDDDNVSDKLHELFNYAHRHIHNLFQIDPEWEEDSGYNNSNYSNYMHYADQQKFLLERFTRKGINLYVKCICNKFPRCKLARFRV